MSDNATRSDGSSAPSGSACRVPVHNLKTVAFPDCAKRCAFIEIMGAGECESACPWKFDHTGNPVDGEKLRQNAPREARAVASRPECGCSASQSKGETA